MIVYPPSQWLIEHLVNEGIITRFADSLPWPGTSGSAPNKPDNLVTVYDVVGFLDGRYQRGGEVISHPGIQFRIRASTYPSGWRKAEEIKAALDAILRVTVMIGFDSKKIQCFKRTTDVLSIGEERETGQQRQLFTINGLVSFGPSS